MLFTAPAKDTMSPVVKDSGIWVCIGMEVRVAVEYDCGHYGVHDPPKNCIYVDPRAPLQGKVVSRTSEISSGFPSYPE